MTTQQLPSTDRLSSLPDKLLSRIFSYLCPIGDGLTLVCTSRTLHEKLIVQLYKEAGRKLHWFPLLFGVTEGKIPVLKRCLEAGAPLDHRWPYVGHFRSLGYYEDLRYCQPLDWAEWSGQEEVRKWLLSNKTTSAWDQFPEQRDSDTVYIPMIQCLVFDVRTTEGSWKPVLYRSEGCGCEWPYPYHPHRIFHSSKIESSLIFPRLAHILIDQSESRGASAHLAAWIVQIWFDLLLCSPNPARLLETGFFEKKNTTQWGLPPRPPKPDVFGQPSFLHTALQLVDQSFAKFLSDNAIKILVLLYLSRANFTFVASVYASMLEVVTNSRLDSKMVRLFLSYNCRVFRDLKDSEANAMTLRLFHDYVSAQLSDPTLRELAFPPRVKKCLRG